jgi:predicted  nucleic acid-binding Zn-ribbon protein
MITNTKCQHCGNVFETDGMNRTEFCPHCGKETSILAQVAVPTLGVIQSHRLWAKIKRPLILFILLPIAILVIIGYFAHRNEAARDRALREKLHQEYTLTPDETNAVLEELAGRAALTDLALWEMNHPGWKSGSAMLDANTERTLSNSFFNVELEKIKNTPTK